MKERTDKLDAVTLAAALTGFHIDAIEGVIGSEISNRTLPASVPPVCDSSRTFFHSVLTFYKRKRSGSNKGSITLPVAGAHI